MIARSQPLVGRHEVGERDADFPGLEFIHQEALRHDELVENLECALQVPPAPEVLAGSERLDCAEQRKVHAAAVCDV